ncbi:MAG: hypothetical protein P8J51_02495 [Dehalococcoidia bacterium]|jgi:hypothetical protein|nr:hypothetical protein [Dehalococcoidia bacterium]
MFNKFKKTVAKVLSKEKKNVSPPNRNRRRYSKSSSSNQQHRNRRKNYNSENQTRVQRTMKSSTKTRSSVKESGEVNKSMQFRSLASYRKRRGKLDPALPEDVAFRSPEDGGDISLKIHHSHSSYSQKDKARIIFHDKSIFVKDSE